MARLVTWGSADESVRRLVLVGSLARSVPPPDELSDIDLQVYAETRERYTRDEAWLSEIAPPGSACGTSTATATS